MAKRAVGKGRAKGAGGARRGPVVALVLVGFVVLAIGVMLRRVYGIGQQKRIGEMAQRREALVSEEQKLLDAIRVASDRKHLIDIATSRLDMRLPAVNQVIDLPRRPLPAAPDTSAR